MQSHNRTRVMVTVAMLAAVSYILAFFEFQIPFFPEFLKLDLSDIPALIAAFALGPIAGVGVELIKNGMQLLSTSTAGLGELANFCIGSVFVGTAGVIYQYKHTHGGALLSCLVGTLAMAITGGLFNYFVLLKLYEQFMPMDQIIAAAAAFVPIIKSKADLVFWSIVPFNIVKGLLVTLVTMLIYKPLSPIIKGSHARDDIQRGPRPGMR